MHTLEHRLGLLRNRLRRLLWLYGLGAAVAAGLAAVVTLGLIDYTVRLSDVGLRLLASLSAAGIIGWSAYRFLYRPLSQRLTNAELARRVERVLPRLRDQLQSAVEFIDQAADDPLAGSPALRQAVIAQAAAESESVDMAAMIDPRPAWRAAMAGGAVLLLAALFVLLSPTASGIALARLVNPFGSLSWPRLNHLLLQDEVARIARGQAFEVEVITAEGSELPDEARVYYRFENADGTRANETDVVRPLGNALLVRRENMQRSFAFRVEGGDDRAMPWHEVEVVAPPQIESLSAELQPPDYTRWPRQTSDGAIRALVGTRVNITATVNKPLRSATLHWPERPPVPAALSADRLHIRVPAADQPALFVEPSGGYWLELVDEDGIAAGSEQKFDIRAVPDSQPAVVLEEPAANVMVTAQAVVLVRVAAKDDLAVRDVGLVYTRSDQGAKETEIPLWRNEQPPSAGTQGDQRVIEHRWDLAALNLAPGMELSLMATASDFKPQAVRSEPRRLVLITAEQLQERLAARQATIVAELERVLKMQQAARGDVESVALRVREVGAVDQADIDRMQAAELSQRQVQRTLTNRGDGVVMHALAMLADIENNRVDSPDMARRMQALLAEIERLDREHLVLISPELVAASKAAQVGLQTPPVDSAGIALNLAGASQHQSAVIQSLEALLAELNQWDSYRRFHRELGALVRDQENLNRQTAETGKTTLTKTLRDLTPQQQADLRVLAGQQLERARRLDRLVGDMQQAAESLRATEPLAADLLRDAADEAGRMATGAKMRAAGNDVQDNQIGRALLGQQDVLKDLQELVDILANRRQQELDRLVKRLAQAEAELADLERQQASLAGRMGQQRGEELQRSGSEQRKLEDQAQRLARRLERLASQERASRTLQDAAAAMKRAAAAAAGNKAGEAGQQADDARRKLADAKRQLAAQRAQAQAELAIEQLAKLDDLVKHLYEQQRLCLDETERLELLRDAEGRLTRGQAMSLADLAKRQRALQTETTAAGEKLQGAGAFRLALDAAARDMGQAADRLDRRETDAAVVAVQRQALGRLDLLLKALAPESPEPGQNDNDNGGAGDQPGAQAGGGVQTLAQLKMLKFLQVDINERTAALQAAIGDEKPTAEQGRELSALAAEQTQLTRLVLEMLTPVEEER